MIFPRPNGYIFTKRNFVSQNFAQCLSKISRKFYCKISLNTVPKFSVWSLHTSIFWKQAEQTIQLVISNSSKRLYTFYLRQIFSKLTLCSPHLLTKCPSILHPPPPPKVYAAAARFANFRLLSIVPPTQLLDLETR
jgi:hypothetical protein